MNSMVKTPHLRLLIQVILVTAKGLSLMRFILIFSFSWTYSWKHRFKEMRCPKG